MAVGDWVPAAIRKAGIERRLAAGDVLFHQGERTAGLYEVIEGRLRLARPNLDGNEIVLHVAAAGETIAEASLFSPRYHCDAIGVTDSLVRLYPKADMLAEFQRSPETAKKIHGNACWGGDEPQN
jgi:CRP/FNR family transcriptional regulator, dissimilatory nitrate respiration regulator